LIRKYVAEKGLAEDDFIITTGSLPVNYGFRYKGKGKGKGKSKDADLKILRSKKRKFLEHVLLTEQEHQKLIELLGQREAEGWIKALDDGIAIHGYKYKDHYRVILRWREKEKKKQPFADVV
jgi:hypothetical protein